MLRRLSLVLAVAAVVVVSLSSIALGWSNGPDYGRGFGTHDWVMFESSRLAGSPGWLDVKRAMAYTDDPDMSFHDTYYHVYDRWGSTYGNSPARVESYYKKAVAAYKAHDYRSTSKYVGLMSHYFSDSCDPLHTDGGSKSENRMHSNWERAVDRRLSAPGKNRSWITTDALVAVTSPTTLTVASARSVHKDYSALVSSYLKSGYGSTVSSITKRSLSKATNGLADLIYSIPIAAQGTTRTYAITASAGEHGSISPASVSVVEGSNQDFVFVPETGYAVEDVVVDGSSVGPLTNYTFYDVRSTHAISVSFAPAVDVTAIAGEGGSILPSGVRSYGSGSSPTYTIAPDSGYRLLDVQVDGVSVGPVLSFTFTNLTESHTLTATFERVLYTIVSSAGDGGYISPAGVQAVGYGDSCAFSITPDYGYQVSDVVVDGLSKGAITEFSFTGVTSDHTISATFQAVSTGGGGTVYITSTGTKFHRAGCRYLSSSSIPISRNDAVAQGYTACSVCNP